jgi:hypothetical protein
MPFTTPLVVRRVSATHWELIAPLSYQGAVDHFTVPDGVVTDFASVPRWLQSFVQATGTWTGAAVLHDAFCIQLAAGSCTVSSSDADGIFRRVMAEEGVGLIRRWLMWTAVRWAALLNPARRPGWLRDAPRILPITAALLILVCAVVYGLDRLAHWIV